MYEIYSYKVFSFAKLLKLYQIQKKNCKKNSISQLFEYFIYKIRP